MNIFKKTLVTMWAAWIIWTWAYKFNELSHEIWDEVAVLMKVKEKNKIDEDIKSLKLEKWVPYLLEVDWVKTLISLRGFSENSYLEWKEAPSMDIYSEYEEDKYFKVLWTFVLPEWKWHSWDVWEDWFRCFNKTPFCYKLDSYDVKEWTMDLDFMPRLEWDLKIDEQKDLSKFDLKERRQLSDDEILKFIKKFKIK